MTIFKKLDWIKNIIIKYKKWCLIVPASLFIAVFFASCEIRSIDPETGEVIIEESRATFNATEYVDDIWKEQVLPSIQNDAVELAQLLDSLQSNAITTEQYDLVKGRAAVIEVDTSSRVGFLRLAMPDLGEQAEVKLQIGPVISGTALRDALPFIHFDQFTNQIQYASISMAMHDKLMKNILADLNYAELEGRIILFRGALLYDEGEIMITPVRIEITGS